MLFLNTIVVQCGMTYALTIHMKKPPTLKNTLIEKVLLAVSMVSIFTCLKCGVSFPHKWEDGNTIKCNNCDNKREV